MASLRTRQKKERELEEALKSLIEGLEAANKAAGPKLRDAANRWAESTAKDALALLNRPRWKLSKYITSKSIEYDDKGKIWAMAGFRFTTKEPREPGYYGQFQEAGWRPAPYRQKSPDHFLRKAKDKNMQELRKDLESVLKDIMAQLEIIRKKG